MKSIINYTINTCSLGTLLAAKTEKGLAAVFIGDDHEDVLSLLKKRFSNYQLVQDDEHCQSEMEVVRHVIDGISDVCDLPLDIHGTAFQRRVWGALQQIPSGARATYTDIAKSLGCPTATRAVASACAANSLAVLIPCHRVIRRDGSLSGYRFGVERKKLLLDREAGLG